MSVMYEADHSLMRCLGRTVGCGMASRCGGSGGGTVGGNEGGAKDGVCEELVGGGQGGRTCGGGQTGGC